MAELRVVEFTMNLTTLFSQRYTVCKYGRLQVRLTLL